MNAPSSHPHPLANSRDNSSIPNPAEATISSRLAAPKQLLVIVLTTILIASIADQGIAKVIGYGIGATYRRVGPKVGPQVFCAGSSDLQYSLAWPEISKRLGQGIEHTNVAGSSPEMWEKFQLDAKNIDTTIVGISVHNLNEYRISRGFASMVPLIQTIRDLRESGTTWQVSRRVLSEYPMGYLRMLFPTAGDQDVFLVGIRRVVRQRLGLASASADAARVLALPNDDLLDFGADEQKLSDLPRDQVLRRLSLMRSDNRGMFSFKGSKEIALRRILDRARQQGRVFVVVLPLSPDYIREFMTPNVTQEFEAVIAEVRHSFPTAIVVRLDNVPTLQSDDNFTDFVHMNSLGRAIATSIFIEQLNPSPDQLALTK